MLDKNLFISLVKTIRTNFDLDKSDEEVKEYCQVVYPFMVKSNIDDDGMKKAVGEFIMKTSGSNFNKLPSVGDFLEVLGMKPKTVEQFAQEQCDLVYASMEKLNMQTMAIFPDRVTNYVLKNYAGGFNSFMWSNNPQNEKMQDLTWRKQAFIKSYISAHDSKRESVEPLKLQRINGRYGAWLVDDKEACKANLLEHDENCLRLESKPQNATIEKLTTTYKGEK